MREDGRRIVYENERAVAFVPYFARYAYEVYVAPKATRPSVAALSDDERRGFHFHVELHPLLRRPNLLKYLAGPEVGGGNFLSDTSPEEKAAELRAAPGIHYKHYRHHKHAAIQTSERGEA